MINSQMPEPSADNDFLVAHAALLIDSYRRLTGRELVAPESTARDSSRALFEASYGVVSHNTEDDPVFNYGNRTALRVFELDWAAFTRLASRESAAPMNREQRAQLLAQVSKKGFVDDYRGERVSATGTRFFIENATIWNLVDEGGEYRGQAAVFRDWSEL